ncbi:hypothetical protein A2U01_0097549, partial [Trifolium medium]|nr:hypothetical protein [Trifolium medium]
FMPPARRTGVGGALRHGAEQGLRKFRSFACRAGRMARRASKC